MKFQDKFTELFESTGPAQAPLTPKEESYLKNNGYFQLIRGRWQKDGNKIMYRVFRDLNFDLKVEAHTNHVITKIIKSIKEVP